MMLHLLATLILDVEKQKINQADLVTSNSKLTISTAEKPFATPDCVAKIELAWQRKRWC